MIGNQQAEDLRRCCDALQADNERLREALAALLDDCETANRKWVDGIGIGAIDLNAISRGRAALQGESHV